MEHIFLSGHPFWKHEDARVLYVQLADCSTDQQLVATTNVKEEERRKGGDSEAFNLL